MAVEIVTVANVKLVPTDLTSNLSSLTAGETLTHGEICYSKAADSNNKWLAQANSADTYQADSMAMTPQTVGGKAYFALAGAVVNPGWTAIEGKVYYLSTGTAGGIDSDAPASANWLMIVGVGTSEGLLLLFRPTTNEPTAETKAIIIP